MPIFKSLAWLDPEKNPIASGIQTRDLPLSRRTPQPLGQRGGEFYWWFCRLHEEEYEIRKRTVSYKDWQLALLLLLLFLLLLVVVFLLLLVCVFVCFFVCFCSFFIVLVSFRFICSSSFVSLLLWEPKTTNRMRTMCCHLLVSICLSTVYLSIFGFHSFIYSCIYLFIYNFHLLMCSFISFSVTKRNSDNQKQKRHASLFDKDTIAPGKQASTHINQNKHNTISHKQQNLFSQKIPS